MGNVLTDLSEEEEAQLIEEALSSQQATLDNPDIDKKLNAGTTVPKCQPKHTEYYKPSEDSSSSEDSLSDGRVRRNGERRCSASRKKTDRMSEEDRERKLTYIQT